MIIALNYIASLNSFVLDKDESVGIPEDIRVKSRSINASLPNTIKIEMTDEVGALIETIKEKDKQIAKLTKKLDKFDAAEVPEAPKAKGK